MNEKVTENLTERVVVLMTSKQKADIKCSAKAERLPLSEFMRRRALGDDAILSVLVGQIRESTRNAAAALDHTLDWLADAQAHQPERDAKARENARAEFAEIAPKG